MPLVATWGHDRVEAWQLDDHAWTTLRSTYRERGLVIACGERAEPVERAGTRFFRHKAKCDKHEGGPESPEHLATKALVAEVARENGWTAVVEAPAADRSWIADVLVNRAGEPAVAVEVQWASQTVGTFASRTQRYERDGIRTVWLVGPKNHGRGDYNIRGTADDLEMEVPDGFTQNRTFTTARAALERWFRNEERAAYEALVEDVEVVTAKSKCHNPRCGAWFSYWWIRALQLRTRCGQRGSVTISSGYASWVTDRPESLFQHEVRDAFAQSSLPAATEYQLEYTRGAGRQYSAQHCPRCRCVLGDHYITPMRRNWQAHRVPVTQKLRTLDHRATAIPHLCVDVGEGRCSTEASQSAHPLEWNKTRDEPSFNTFMPSSASIQVELLPPREAGATRGRVPRRR